MHWIEHPSDPRELLLAWQAAPSVQDRSRWAVGRLWLDGAEAIFQDPGSGRVLEAEPRAVAWATTYRRLQWLPGIRGEQTTAGWVPRPRVSSLPPESATVFAARLPSLFGVFQVQPGTRLSPMSLLAITEGRLPSDGFSLVDPLDPALSTVDALFEIAGFRHVRSDDMLRADQQLVLERDASNPVDPTAVQVISSRGQLVGYVNRLQSPTVCQWIGHRRLSCWVARLNGQPGAPRAYGLMRVRPA